MPVDTSGKTVAISKGPPFNEFTASWASPAVAWFKGRFWVAWMGIGNQQLNIVGLTALTNGTYAEDTSSKRTLNSTSNNGPALVGDGTRLWMAFTGLGESQLSIVSALDGNDFTPASKVILNSESARSPSLAIFNGLWLGWSGVNDQDFAVMGPSMDGHFNINTRRSVPTPTSDPDFPSVGAICNNNQGALNVVLTTFPAPNQNGITVYRWVPGAAFPPSPLILPVKGVGMSAAMHGTEMWITSFFPASGSSYYWYVYRIVGNNIVGAASISSDTIATPRSPVAISDSGVVGIVWTGFDGRVNFGTLPANTGH
jgi:hypothetical protein